MDKKEILQILQEYQLKYINKVDISIETRKDQRGMQIILHMCNYGMDENNKIDIKNRSKLYVHRFYYNKPEKFKYELQEIESELKLLEKMY